MYYNNTQLQCYRLITKTLTVLSRKTLYLPLDYTEYTDIRIYRLPFTKNIAQGRRIEE